MKDSTTSPSPSESICYGAAKAQFSFSKGLTAQSRPWSRFHTFQLVARQEFYHLAQVNGTGTEDVGMLDLITTKHLHSLGTFLELSFTAVIASSNLTNILRKPTHNKAIVDISVNIMGPERIAGDVGDTLANASAYLQHPFFLQIGIRYINPQYFYSGNEKTDLRHLIDPLTTDPRSMHVSEGIENMLESLDDLSRLAVLPERQAISAAGDGPILTPLKRHQENGVWFILNREDPAFCDSVTSDLKALIGSRYFSHRPELCLGGIVADIMGLGKTLTMLSAVVRSKNAAAQFAKIGSCRNEPRFTRATLIVVTSRQVLDVWTSEIEKHLRPDTLRVAVFHGDSRAKTTEALVDHDVVLTTYRTLAMDWKGRRVLQEIGWYRVVLDEAHWIRNQSSEQFNAAKDLEAGRRWCLTGTPIQNSLADLRSLLRFLHFQPFASQAFFEKHIVEPLRMNSHDSFRNLQLLLRVICLRRNAGYLHLPPAETEEVLISLTSEETAVYDGILADCQAEFDKIVSGKSEIRKYNVLFITIMKLRRLCNHGTFQAATPTYPTLSRKARKSKKQQMSTDAELSCDFCSREDEDTATLLDSLESLNDPKNGSKKLTLTVANRVHIVEPQWNPSVEEQAIARALRMGQTRTVTIVKYITIKTVEQNILALQKKKTELAKFSLDGGTDNNATGRLDSQFPDSLFPDGLSSNGRFPSNPKHSNNVTTARPKDKKRRLNPERRYSREDALSTPTGTRKPARPTDTMIMVVLFRNTEYPPAVGKPRGDFTPTLPEDPYHIRKTSTSHSADSCHEFPDQNFLQFFTWQASFHIVTIDTRHSSGGVDAAASNRGSTATTSWTGALTSAGPSSSTSSSSRASRGATRIL
ncbi:hypothetical protein DL771_009826 [Monosporascus sp. 5C6A]|nr:hypothetical protein DL771_009826 [Monosporascus sp. 5C6A]